MMREDWRMEVMRAKVNGMLLTMRRRRGIAGQALRLFTAKFAA